MSDSSHSVSPRWTWLALALVVAVIPLVPLVTGFTSDGPTVAQAQDAGVASNQQYDPISIKPSVQGIPDRFLPAGTGALTVLVTHRTTMLTGPGHGHRIARVGLQTGFGSPQVFWVTKLSGKWLGVVSSLAGNGRIGWIPASAGTLLRNNWELHASIAKRQLTVLHDGKALYHWSIAVGRPTAPTPTGRFAVTDLLSTGDPAGPYGCCILALSALAPHAISEWDGGNRIAVHSTPETSSIGLPVSHGCMRLTLAEGRWLLTHIPLGTPAIVSSA